MTIETITPADASYPRGLLQLDAPPDLRVRGALARGPTVTIVGTRDPTDEARAYAEELAGSLASNGVVVWSGGAIGIDTAAHEGALAVAGVTVVVFGGGLERLYPPSNLGLFERVVQGGGALVSCFEDQAPAMTPRFFTRNRLLAAAADVTIVIECELKSGARNAAANARRLGKPLAVVVQPPWTRRGLGCYEELAKFGALPLRDEAHALDLVIESHRGRWGDADLPERVRAALPADEPRDPIERAIAAAIARGASDVDSLCAAVDAPTSLIVASVFELVLRGEVEETHRGLVVSRRKESGKSRAKRE